MTVSGVNIRELKANLSKYLKQVKAGETVVITERGKPIGRIIPETGSLENRLAGLVQAGLAEWSGKPLRPRQPAITNRSETLISDLVSELRDDTLP
jgi:prevent-host-death family protein